MLTSTLTKAPVATEPVMTGKPEEERDLHRQRSNAVRTAWVLAAIATAIFAAFVLSGVLGQPTA